MRRHETTTQTGSGPSLRARLVQSLGWLAVLGMLALSSPGVGIERAAEPPPVVGTAQAP